MENDYGFPVGTRVIMKTEFKRTATVIGHELNCLRQPLVVVRDDASGPDSSVVFYPSELEIMT